MNCFPRDSKWGRLWSDLEAEVDYYFPLVFDIQFIVRPAGWDKSILRYLYAFGLERKSKSHDVMDFVRYLLA